MPDSFEFFRLFIHPCIKTIIFTQFYKMTIWKIEKVAEICAQLSIDGVSQVADVGALCDFNAEWSADETSFQQRLMTVNSVGLCFELTP